MSKPDTPDQKAYWNENLDPQNLGVGFEADRFNYPQELIYYLTPDQEWALQQFAPLNGKRVLDVGAGIGTNALFMAQQGATVLAIDIAQDRLAVLRQIAKRILGKDADRIQPVKCAAEALPFRPGVFDHCYSKSVIIHTRIPDAALEMSRVLRQGATGIFIEPMTRNPFVNLYRNTFAPQIWKSITRYFSQREMAELTGPFSSHHIQPYYFFAFFAFVFQFAVRWPGGFRLLLAILHGLDSTLFRFLPVLRRFAWFAAIRVLK